MFKNKSPIGKNYPVIAAGSLGLAILIGGLLLGWVAYLWISIPPTRNGDQSAQVNEPEVIQWMESVARAEREFEQAWLNSSDDPAVFSELERALAIQARLKVLDPDDSFGSVSRYQKLVDRLETTKGKFLFNRAQALAEEASQLTEEGPSAHARELWQEALAAQEWINQRLQGSEWADDGAVARMRQTLVDLESQASAEEIDIRVSAGQKAFAEAQWDKAEEQWSQALKLQESLNFHSPQSRHARRRLAQEIKERLRRVEAARLNHQIENLLIAEEGGASVEELQQAYYLQQEINEQYPLSEFYRPDRQKDLEKRLIVGQSSTLAASISQQMETLNESLQAADWEAVGPLLRSLEQSVGSFLDRFPASLLPDAALPQRIEWLSQREADIPALLEEMEARLVRHPRVQGLRMLVSEVDQALFSRIMGTNPSRKKGDEWPVDSVSFDQAKVFCQRLGWMMGRAVQLPRLNWLTVPELKPVRQEDLWLAPAAKNQSQPVGSSQPVGGFFDLYGNLEEWILHPDPAERAWLFGGNGTQTFHTITRQPTRGVALHFRSRWTGFRFCVLGPIATRDRLDPITVKPK